MQTTFFFSSGTDLVLSIERSRISSSNLPSNGFDHALPLLVRGRLEANSPLSFAL